jgi:hypothetical protein
MKLTIMILDGLQMEAQLSDLRRDKAVLDTKYHQAIEQAKKFHSEFYSTSFPNVLEVC